MPHEDFDEGADNISDPEETPRPVTAPQPTRYVESNGGSGGTFWAVSFIMAIVILCVIGAIFFPQTTATTITNITITEKYPAHTYQSTCGKYTCQLTDPPSLVDENGNVYGVADQRLWGMLRPNTTYQVRYYKSQTGGAPNTIDGAVINGTTYVLKGGT